MPVVYDKPRGRGKYTFSFSSFIAYNTPLSLYNDFFSFVNVNTFGLREDTLSLQVIMFAGGIIAAAGYHWLSQSCNLFAIERQQSGFRTNLVDGEIGAEWGNLIILTLKDEEADLTSELRPRVRQPPSLLSD